MGLFSKKKKYDIDEKNNIPQVVYGIPDDLRKKWEEEKSKKIEKNVFEAFKGGFFGPSSYYFIDKLNDTYRFKFGYSRDGRMINSEDSNLLTIDQNKEYYDNFIKDLLKEVEEWKEFYDNPNIMDGTQWDIELKEHHKSYHGSNDFPTNFKSVTKLLSNYFNTDQYNKEEMSKYDIKVEDNIPREVYGIPDFMRQKDNYEIQPENNLPQKLYGIPNITPSNKKEPESFDTDESIRIEIKNDNNDYVLVLNHHLKNDIYKIMFADLNHLEDKMISDTSTNIPKRYYQEFKEKLLNCTSNWNDNYNGNNNVSWNIVIKKDGTEKRIKGTGEYPNNWNNFIDLVVEYEKIFKVLKEKEIEEIEKI